MLLYLDFFRGHNARDNALFIGDKRGAEHAHCGAAVHLLFSVHVEGFNEALLRVANEWEGELVFFDKLLVRFLVLNAASKHFVALRKETFVIVAQVAGLIGATRSRIARINV